MDSIIAQKLLSVCRFVHYLLYTQLYRQVLQIVETIDYIDYVKRKEWYTNLPQSLQGRSGILQMVENRQSRVHAMMMQQQMSIFKKQLFMIYMLIGIVQPDQIDLLNSGMVGKVLITQYTWHWIFNLNCSFFNFAFIFY